jgi:hypothetical protein
MGDGGNTAQEKGEEAMPHIYNGEARPELRGLEVVSGVPLDRHKDYDRIAIEVSDGNIFSCRAGEIVYASQPAVVPNSTYVLVHRYRYEPTTMCCAITLLNQYDNLVGQHCPNCERRIIAVTSFTQELWRDDTNVNRYTMYGLPYVEAETARQLTGDFVHSQDQQNAFVA